MNQAEKEFLKMRYDDALKNVKRAYEVVRDYSTVGSELDYHYALGYYRAIKSLCKQLDIIIDT